PGRFPPGMKAFPPCCRRRNRLAVRRWLPNDQQKSVFSQPPPNRCKAASTRLWLAKNALSFYPGWIRLKQNAPHAV
ncbi:MAG: hypothetical protein FWH41_08205, partial [Treponema sp.]|nr:hypothetical protein [Treponema sp.]